MAGKKARSLVASALNCQKKKRIKSVCTFKARYYFAFMLSAQLFAFQASAHLPAENEKTP
jgi:hypothetical protein